MLTNDEIHGICGQARKFEAAGHDDLREFFVVHHEASAIQCERDEQIAYG